MSSPVMKRCVRCRLLYLASEYYVDDRKRDGLSSWCKGCQKERSKQAYRSTVRATYHEYRSAAAEVYGGKCHWCGDSSALEFDHVNGGGKEHRKRETHKQMYRRIAESGVPLTDVQLSLLCAVCHQAKSQLDMQHRRLAARGVALGGYALTPTPPQVIRCDAQAIISAVLEAVAG